MKAQGDYRPADAWSKRLLIQEYSISAKATRSKDKSLREINTLKSSHLYRGMRNKGKTQAQKSPKMIINFNSKLIPRIRYVLLISENFPQRASLQKLGEVADSFKFLIFNKRSQGITKKW